MVAAGLEHVIGIKVPKEDVLQFVGQALQLEQRNQAMNFFIGMTLEKFHEDGIEAVLIKGQGVAQCYAKPEWRSAGDVDLLLNEENYEKGKAFLKGISETEPEEYSFNKEYITTFGGWCLELHGSLRCGLSAALNKEVDAIQKEICDNHHVRYWEAAGKQIPLPEEKVHTFIIASGNFGHNIDGSYFRRYPFLIRKTISMWRRMGVLLRHSLIFPWHSIKFMPYVLFTGLSSAAKGE